MDKANHPGADAKTVRSAFEAAQVVVRTHNKEFADYFASRLVALVLQYDKGEFKFSFHDAGDVAQAFEMTTMQQVNDTRSKAASIGVVNLLLKDLKYPSSFSCENSYLTAMLMIAHAIHAYRIWVFNQVVAEQQRKSKVSVWPYVIAGVCIVGAGFFLLGG